MKPYTRDKARDVALFIFVFAILAYSIGCDRVRQSFSPEKTDSIEIKMESLIDRVATRDKEDVEEAHKKGHLTTVGLLDGKAWLGNNDDERRAYIIGVSDLVSAHGTVLVLTLDEIINQEKKGLQRQKAQTTYTSLLESQLKLSNRVREVTAGHTFGDIIEAVTKFYQNNPLLRDKPVLWVLAVPLYKELQDARPTDKKDTDNDIVTLWMKRK